MSWFERLTDHSRIDHYLRQTGIELATFSRDDVPVAHDPGDFKHLVHWLLVAYIKQSGGLDWADDDGPFGSSTTPNVRQTKKSLKKRQ